MEGAAPFGAAPRISGEESRCPTARSPSRSEGLL